MRYIILLIILLNTVACQRKYICPAYQSSFILDKQKTESFFSMFGADSLPKSNLIVKKNKYGIIVKVKYGKKIKDLENIIKELSNKADEASHSVKDIALRAIDSSSKFQFHERQVVNKNTNESGKEKE